MTIINSSTAGGVLSSRGILHTLILFSLFLCAPILASAATYYVAPSGSNSSPGTQAAPFATLQKAHDVAVAGDTIFMRGGTYTFASQTTITRSGSSGNLIKIVNYPGELPVIDAINQPINNYVIFLSNASWWHIKGLEMKNGTEGGIRVDNSHNNIIEGNNSHHHGRLTGGGVGLRAINGASNNLFLNNDGHDNLGTVDPGGADGFYIASTGGGNVWRGNRAWRNSDDGFDNFCTADNQTCQGVLAENNWSFRNGFDVNGTYRGGNGEGYKMGGRRPGTSGHFGGHTFKNNMAWGNWYTGFNQAANGPNQANPDTVYNNTSWNNGGPNYYFADTPASVLRNNISFGTNGKVLGDQFNSWNLPVTVNAADFASTDDTCAFGPRQANGTLPNCTFLHLASGSDLIDKGTNVGTPYNGSAPDLGVDEYSGAGTDSTPPTVSITAPANGATVSGTAVTVSANASDNVGVSGVQFKLDGANLGAEDTSSPYSISWNTTTATSGSHTLTAVARDAAGNIGTSAGVTVTVNYSGPISLWKFDESSGTTASDFSGTNTATLSGGASFTAGRLGNALNLNGIDGQAKDNTTTGLNLTSALTVAAWIKPTTLPAAPAYRNIVAKGDVAGHRGYALNIYGNNLNFTKVGVLNVPSTVAVPVGAFHHVAVTWDAPAGQVKFYLDGTLAQTVSNTTAIGSPLDSDPLTIGSWLTGGSWFNGLLDDVRIYNRALSTTEVATLATPPAPDTTPPMVSITAPASGATASGTSVTVSANASDNVGVGGVQFKLDGANLGAEDITAPYSVTWDITTAAVGSHTLTAVARDAAGNTATSAGVSVTVPDATSPTVSITAPASGATVSGTSVTVSANASDNVGVGGVQFKLDGANLGAEDITAPYSVTWDITTAAVGSHTLTAVARDAAGNTTTSDGVSVTVPDATSPTVSITAPASGATVSGTSVTVSANASDNVRVGGVQFKLDGANLGAEDITAPYSVTWDITTAAVGSHTLTAVARDAAGNTTTSDGVSVTVPDATSPTVSITAPASSATVSGISVTVSANASDNVGVGGVQFKVDGANLGAEDTSSPYSISWNTTTATSGSHTLTAVARDAAGNIGTSAGVTVTVNYSGPISLWKFDESSGTTASDASGTNTATLSGGASFTAGRLGNAFNLNGIDGQAKANTTTGLNLTQTITIAAWIKPTSLPSSGYSTVAVKGDLALGRGYGLNIYNGYLNFVKVGRTNVRSTIAVPTGAFHHVAVTWDALAGQVKFYLDGTLAQTVSNTTVIGSSLDSDPLTIGSWLTGGAWFNGLLDDVRIYNSVLSTTEVATLAIPPAPDTTPPAVSLTAPASGATVSDTTAPPSVPTGLTAVASASQVSLSWKASTDNVGVTGYRVYRNGTQVAAPASNSYIDGNLVPATYSYTVAAVDAAGNVSKQSESVSATITSTAPGVLLAPSRVRLSLASPVFNANAAAEEKT